MLIKCPECDLQVSDKALNCPHCGFPIKGKTRSHYSKKTGHKRLPNGFGQISKMNNPNLRKPWRAMVTIGKSDTGKPICRLLKPEAYFETYNDAYIALLEHNRNPYDPKLDITLDELYSEWSKRHFEKLDSYKSVQAIESAWKNCEPYKEMHVKDIRPGHIKEIIDTGKTPSVKTRMKSIFNMLFDYAMEYGVVTVNQARTFKLDEEVVKELEKNRKKHISFTNEEFELLKQNKNVPYVDVVLFQCYSGMRPQELGIILKENVDLKNNIIVGGLKTPAGIDRKVPIHSKVKYIVEKWMKQSKSKYLFTDEKNLKLTYNKYNTRFHNVMDALHMDPEHRAHDPRKHFVTMAKKYKVDEYAIKFIVGHTVSDITEAVYTDRDPKWLNEEIEKIEGDAH